MKRILFISRNLACPDFHGGCVYPYRVLEALATAGVAVHYLWLPEVLPNRPFRLPFRPSFAERVSVLGAFSQGSFFVKNPFRSKNRANSICSLLRANPAEVVLDFLWDAQLLRDLPVRTWILTHELIHKRAQSYQQAEVIPDFTVLDEVEESRLLGNANGLIAIQDEDAAWLRGRFPNKPVVVLPLPCERKTLPPPPTAPPSVLFIGGKTAHNRYGLEWLADEVWPRVLDRLPEARLRIYGTVPTRGLLPSGGFDVRGPVVDVASAYSENQVAAVPLRFGSGLKIKLLEAMSFGLPTVATPVGAQGFADLQSGEVCPVCEDAVSFSDALVRLLTGSLYREAVVARQDAWLKKMTDPVHLAGRLSKAMET